VGYLFIATTMTGKIFINYRRGDDPGNTGRLFDQLEDVFPREQLFIDVDSIPPGRDFVRVLEEQVAQCDVLLAVIGKGWIDARDEQGLRRLDKPDDFVRIEIESALRQDKAVIPVLVQDARMPKADELPESLKPLARRHAVRLTHERFKAETQALIKSIQQLLDEVSVQRRAEEEAARKAQAEEDRRRQDADLLRTLEQHKADEQAREAASGLAAERQQQEAEAWGAASRTGDATALAAFLSDWPQSQHVKAARARLTELKGTPSRRRFVLLGGAAALVTVGVAYLSAPPSDPRKGLLRTYRPLSEDAAVSCVAFSPDGRTALAGGSDRVLKLWHLETGAALRTFTGHRANSVAFSPDGGTALSGSQDGVLKLWEISSGRMLRDLTGHSGEISRNSVAFSPDGRTALSGSKDKTLRLWDVATGKTLRTLVGHVDAVSSVAFSPDGRELLSGSDDKTLKLWEAATGKELRTFKWHSKEVLSVAFSPDGRTALSGSLDRTLKLWDVATGKELRTLTGQRRVVVSVAFVLGGRRVLSGDDDDELKLWDVATGKELHILRGELRGSIQSVAVSPDGRRALAAKYEGPIELWDLTRL
jgi:hypothetical protein